MSQKDLSDEDLEEELDKTFKTIEIKKFAFMIIRQEKRSLEVKEKRV